MSDRGGHGVAGAEGGARAPRLRDLPGASHDDRAESIEGRFELPRPGNRFGERRDRDRASHSEHHTTVTWVPQLRHHRGLLAPINPIGCGPPNETLYSDASASRSPFAPLKRNSSIE